MSSARVYGLTVTGSSGGEELVLCPFHSDNHASAWWNGSKDLFYCAVCGFGMTGSALAEKLGIEVEEEDGETEIEDYSLMEDTPVWDLGKLIYDPYIASRGISKATMETYGLRWTDNPTSAAVFLHTDLFGDLSGVQYRYINPTATGTRYRIQGKPQPLWPMSFLKDPINLQNPLVITEGGWSAMRLHQHLAERGVHVPVMALLGAKANVDIVNTVRPFECIFLYDNDQAGRRACSKMRSLLPSAYSWVVNTSPDDMSKKQLNKLLQRIAAKIYDGA